MKPIRLITAAALLVAAFAPAFAADAIFPPGIRVGLTPLPGLAPAKAFSGFATEDQSVKVLIAELPVQAYSDVVNNIKANPAGPPAGSKPQAVETAAGPAYYTIETAKEGANTLRRYALIMSGGTFAGYIAMQVPENATKIYSDDAVRQMFASVTFRAEIPVDEQLGLLPFKLSELGSFKNVRTLAPGAAIILADGDEKTGFEPAPFMVIGLIAATAQEPADRARFAQEAATSIPGVREARITMSEPIRIDSQPAFETRIDAVSGKDNTKVTIVQWLRFGGPNTLRIIGSAPRDGWSNAFPRFRAVRDGIQPRG